MLPRGPALFALALWAGSLTLVIYSGQAKQYSTDLGAWGLVKRDPLIGAMLGARQAVRFYGPRLGLAGWTEGGCHRRNTVEYFRELDQYRGHDGVWVIWTHSIPRFGAPKAIRSYLSAAGPDVPCGRPANDTSVVR